MFLLCFNNSILLIYLFCPKTSLETNINVPISCHLYLCRKLAMNRLMAEDDWQIYSSKAVLQYSLNESKRSWVVIIRCPVEIRSHSNPVISSHEIIPIYVWWFLRVHKIPFLTFWLGETSKSGDLYLTIYTSRKRWRTSVSNSYARN